MCRAKISVVVTSNSAVFRKTLAAWILVTKVTQTTARPQPSSYVIRCISWEVTSKDPVYLS